MSNTEDSGGVQTGGLGTALHEICQPLTTLQCRLELAEMVGTEPALREAVRMGLLECARMVQAIAVMRGIVRGAESAGAGPAG
jgi:hypothetical protein